MRIGNTKPYKIHNYTNTKTSDGRTINKYSDDPFIVNGYAYNMGGTLDIQRYGDNVTSMYKMLCNGNWHEVIINGVIAYTDGVNTIKPKDGICLFSDKPDFKIVSIAKHGHLIIDLELIS